MAQAELLCYPFEHVRQIVLISTSGFILQTYCVSHKEVILINYSGPDSDPHKHCVQCTSELPLNLQ